MAVLSGRSDPVATGMTGSPAGRVSPGRCRRRGGQSGRMSRVPLNQVRPGNLHSPRPASFPSGLPGPHRQSSPAAPACPGSPATSPAAPATPPETAVAPQAEPAPPAADKERDSGSIQAESRPFVPAQAGPADSAHAGTGSAEPGSGPAGDMPGTTHAGQPEAPTHGQGTAGLGAALRRLLPRPGRCGSPSCRGAFPADRPAEPPASASPASDEAGTRSVWEPLAKNRSKPAADPAAAETVRYASPSVKAGPSAWETRLARQPETIQRDGAAAAPEAAAADGPASQAAPARPG